MLSWQVPYLIKMNDETLEKARLKEIERINEFYNRKKEEIKKDFGKKVEDYSFDVITDVILVNGKITYCKRKAIFLHHLTKNFEVKPIRWKRK